MARQHVANGGRATHRVSRETPCRGARADDHTPPGKCRRPRLDVFEFTIGTPFLECIKYSMAKPPVKAKEDTTYALLERLMLFMAHRHTISRWCLHKYTGHVGNERLVTDFEAPCLPATRLSPKRRSGNRYLTLKTCLSRAGRS